MSKLVMKKTRKKTQHLSERLWSHAARVGYAWRQARRDSLLVEAEDMDMIWDLHAELLGRLGLKIRPSEKEHCTTNKKRARLDVQDAMDYLVNVANPD